jgi:ureidoglycolate amidohydrolase
LAGSEVLVEALKTTVDAQNRSFLDAARSAEYAKDQDDLSSVFLKKGTYSAFVELHIEQGPLLEEEGRIISMPLLHYLYILNSRQSSLFAFQVYLLG